MDVLHLWKYKLSAVQLLRLMAPFTAGMVYVGETRNQLCTSACKTQMEIPLFQIEERKISGS